MEYKHWCGNCQIRVYFERHYGKRLSWEDCPYNCEYAVAMRCSTQNGRGYDVPTIIEAEEGERNMSETLREMTYDEQIADFIMHILAIETPFGVKRDLISHLLSLTYRHERDIKDALYTPTPSCSFKAEEEVSE